MGLRELEQEVEEAEDTMMPGVRGRLGVVRAVALVLRLSLTGTLLLGPYLGAQVGALIGPVATSVGFVLGVTAGLFPEAIRHAVLMAGYRHVLARAGGHGLQAVGGTTPAALPSFTAPKSSSSPPPAPAFVAPVRPPPRVGDLDAEDFDD